jgi:alanine dehydrogenase
MAELLVLSEADVRRNLPLDELADALTAALIALSNGAVSVPARTAAFAPDGLLGAMPGYVPGLGLAVKLVTVYPHNGALDTPSHQALIAVFDDASGTPRVLMGGTYITAMRTGMTSALAVRALARANSRSAAIIGAGVQGAAHLVALTQLMSLSEIRVYSRDPERATRLAEGWTGAVVAPSARTAVAGADIICCCTDAAEVVIADAWVEPGAHVSSVGSGAELPQALLARSRVFVESRGATARPPAGAAELQGWDPASLTELGEVLAGSAPGRTAAYDVTVFKSTGHAAEDVAAAAVVVTRAAAVGAGTVVDLAE